MTPEKSRAGSSGALFHMMTPFASKSTLRGHVMISGTDQTTAPIRQRFSPSNPELEYHKTITISEAFLYEV